MMRMGLFAAACTATLAIGAPASAGLLNLVLEDNPDIFSDFIDVTFDAGSDSLIATGFALTLDDGNGLHNITSGTFDLTASIDDFGVAGSGSLTIGGDVLGFVSPLLTGNLLDFGFVDSGGQILEFLFEVTGGDLANEYGGPGFAFGVIMDLNSGSYSGDWTQSFDNLMGGTPGTGSGVADTGPLIPGPSAMAMLLAAGVMARRRRRRDESIA